MNAAAETGILPTLPPASAIDESVVAIDPPGAELIAVLARPADSAQTKSVGVVIVVGGPQTRVGSHRQFVIMARALAAAGHPCLRFDYTGMGDSPGPKPDFEKAGPDIGRACDAMLAEVTACRRIALWGLCDGATAAIFHAQANPRIAAVIAANPWARSEATRAQAVVTEHYGSRLRSPEFWKKLVTGKVDLIAAGREAVSNLLKAGRAMVGSVDASVDESLPARLGRALAVPNTTVRLQLSGKDLTAVEFQLALNKVAPGALDQMETLRIDTADHTFSDPAAWRKVIDDTIGAVNAL
ncbi:hydrolase 1, exosortase A system-associated [Zeimonas arvi]|uniref:Hydrolase 1, exosortase A system-associated n=1 Tax=Zeimonas arvi TaxID=2498847 RepID=A0A5C8NXF1_9BURK|nr:hydrolase 1, exosortase A system-associated [Zeimonas arvi]TXL65968.1 hydrolase 1, exosortase A system-associated [Zeimonas arvi]